MSSEVSDGALRAARGGSHCIDVARSRFPFALVWTPLPLISWLLPCIGHLGICDSTGAVHDFQGPYAIGVDDMAFGKPTRFVVLDPALAAAAGGGGDAVAAFDAGVDAGCNVYSRRFHNIFCDNCHHHVAACLSAMRYAGRSDWGQVELAAWVFFRGRYVSAWAVLQTWLPLALIVAAIALLRVFA